MSPDGVNAAVEIVARSREHQVESVYATAIVVLLVPQRATGCNRVVFYNPWHDIHSAYSPKCVSVRCPRRSEHAGESPGTAR